MLTLVKDVGKDQGEEAHHQHEGEHGGRLGTRLREGTLQCCIPMELGDGPIVHLTGLIEVRI